MGPAGSPQPEPHTLTSSPQTGPPRKQEAGVGAPTLLRERLMCGVKLQTHPTSQRDHRGQGGHRGSWMLSRGPWDGSQRWRRVLAQAVGVRGQRATRSRYAGNCIHTYTPPLTRVHVYVLTHIASHVCANTGTHAHTHTGPGCHAKGRGLSREPAPLLPPALSGPARRPAPTSDGEGAGGRSCHQPHRQPPDPQLTPHAAWSHPASSLDAVRSTLSQNAAPPGRQRDSLCPRLSAARVGGTS